MHSAQINSIKFNVYQNDAYGIKIDYPDIWDKVDFRFGPLFVGFITTEKNEIGIPENLVLQTNESESYNGVSAKDLATKAINIYESQIPDFKLIGTNSYETHSGLGYLE